MNVLVLLMFASLTLAGIFLAGFIWAVWSGQFEDTCTPSMRILSDEPQTGGRSSLSLTPPTSRRKAR